MTNIKLHLQNHSPLLISTQGNRQASVAMVLRNLDSVPQMFFIQRAHNENDPWSGQIAFPGGNRDDADCNAVATAMRETDEEVGIQLPPGSLVGRLNDQQGRNNYHSLDLVISCFVFEIRDHRITHNNYEVADSFWVDVAHLRDVVNRVQHITSYSPEPYPGILLDPGRVLWGLTYRFVEMFLEQTES
jgi:8-oxo-dGTP pyrophosphatase MutT (NUDIX family)